MLCFDTPFARRETRPHAAAGGGAYVRNGREGSPMSFIRRLAGAVALIAVSTAAGEACAQASASQTTQGSVTIFQPIALAKDTDLSFGVVVRPVTGSGNVTINATTGARTADSGIGLLNTGTFTGPGRATFTVTGEGGQTFTVGIPVSFTMTRTGGSETIVVTLASSTATATLSNALGATGTANFGVGGTIPVAAATASGAYTGNFLVTVNYN
jgi:hypothetical protein